MDFWLVAAVAGAGYLSKHWRNISKDWDKNGRMLLLSSGASSELNKSEANGAKRRGKVEKASKKVEQTLYDIISEDDPLEEEIASTSGNYENYPDLGVLSVSHLHPGFSGNEELQEYDFSKDYFGLPANPTTEQIDSNNGSVRNMRSLRAKLFRGQFGKPMNSMESCLMAQLYKERAEMDEFVISSLPSPASPKMRTLVVSDGNRIIGNARRSSFCAFGTTERKLRNQTVFENDEQITGVPQLQRIECLDRSRMKNGKNGMRRDGKLSRSCAKTDGKIINPQGSQEGIILLCLGISIGIMSTLMTSKSEVERLKESLKQSESLVQDLQEELELKDSLTVKELVNENFELQDTNINTNSNLPTDDTLFSVQNPDGSSENISKIEAELEAELERLGLNMEAPNLGRRFSDVIELDPEFSASFSQGELRVDFLKEVNACKSKSNDDADSSSTTNHSGNYAVSPRELTMRLHGVIQSRLEDRVNELETALQNSERKVRIMESGRKDSGELGNGCLSFSSRQLTPLTMNLSGQALDAYKEAREELMRMSDSEEEDSPTRIYEDIPCPNSALSSVRGQNDEVSGSNPESAAPEEKSVAELFPGNLRVTDDDTSVVLGSNNTSNSDCEDEAERELIKQIVERTKKGSPVVINAQRLLFSLDN